MRINGLDLVRLIEQAQRLEEFEEAIARAAPGAADAGTIVDFFEVPTADAFDVPPAQAIGYFKAKGLRPTFSYAEMLGEAHDHAFTVAKMMDVDLLGQVRASLDSALANGTPFKEWADNLLPTLQAAGWWGRKEVLDPLTGQTIVAQLGSPWRLQTIFRTNMQTAYAAGQWQEIADQADLAPFLMYDAVDDFRTREAHRAWDRKVLPVSSAWWKTHYPPNGWNCRCGVIQLDATEVKRLGLQVSQPPNDGTYSWKNPKTGELQQVPFGLDPGFDKNAGVTYLQSLKKLLADKIDTLPAGMQAAANSASANEQLQKMVAELEAAQAQAAAEIQKAEAAAALNLRKMQAKVAERAKELDAQEQLDAIAKGKEAVGGAGAQYKVKALAQLKKGDAWPELKPSEKLAQVLDQAAALKVQNETASKLALYKKAILEGKTPAPAAVKAFNTLAPADQAALLEKLAADKAAAAAKKAAEEAAQLQAQAAAKPAAPPKVVTGTPPNPAALTQVGPQRGSNPGGLFKDTDTGVEWYIKQPSNPDVARNEVLAAKLYELAGIEVPELHLIEFNGVTSIASRIVDGLSKGAAADLAKAAGTADGFVVDAWLANWDVVGMGFDNLLLKGARAFRVDTGGALRYRAQGGLKGSAWGDDVPELQSLRDPSLNRQAHAVFGNLNDAQIEAAAVRVLALGDDQIRDVVRLYGPTDQAENAAMIDRLIARRQAIARRYPEAARKARAQDVAAEAPPPAAARVTDAEQRAVEDARVNGYGFATDSEQIEDHMVVVHAFKRTDGSEATRGFFKLRSDASRQLAERIADSVQDADPSVEITQAREAVLAAVKSINYRADKGQPFDVTVENKVKNALLEIDALKRNLAKQTGTPLKPEQAQYIEAVFTEWRDALAASLHTIKARGPAMKVTKTFPNTLLPDRLDYTNPAPKKATGTAWRRVTGSYNFTTSEFDRSFAKETGNTAQVSGVSLRYEATLPDGTKITYFPHDSSVAWAMQGVVKIDAPGRGTASTSRVFGAIDEMGLKSDRATELDRQHLYANAFARVRLVGSSDVTRLREQFEAIEGTDEAALAQKLALLQRATGVDIRASRGWAAVDGVRQAFGHGRAYMLRPDLDTPKFEEFARDHILFHNPQGLGTDAGSGVFDRLKMVIEGGGMMASLTDRVRRGVPLSGSSVSSDLLSGGGDYLFTRIRRRGTTGTGVYWKAAQLRRMDAITYDSDNFGRTTEGHIEKNRKGQGVDSFKIVAGNSGNETIFKGGLSLFDDVDRIVLSNESEVTDAIKWLQARGYKTWPDGRHLADVIITKAKNSAKP